MAILTTAGLVLIAYREWRARPAIELALNDALGAGVDGIEALAAWVRTREHQQKKDLNIN